MPQFVSGAELSARLHEEAVRPLLTSTFPGLPYAAALLGRGSEVLGFDDEMSTDHDWGARVLVFLTDEDDRRHGSRVREVMERDLPPDLAGHEVRLEVHTVRDYVMRLLGLDLDGSIGPRDWLAMSESVLRQFTSGVVHHDEVGLEAARERLAYYPRDVWLYLLVTGWWRVHPEMNLVGRAGAAGDELGSSVIGSRLVGDLMRLAFLMERRYAPYSKWFGTAFSRLECGPELAPLLRDVVQARTWPDRELALGRAYERMTVMHNALGLTDPVTTEPVRLWDRPFTVAWAGIPDLLMPLIEDPAVVAIAQRWPAGPVDQLRDLMWPSRDHQLLRRLVDDAVSPGPSSAAVEP